MGMIQMDSDGLRLDVHTQTIFKIILNKPLCLFNHEKIISNILYSNCNLVTIQSVLIKKLREGSRMGSVPA